MLYDEIGRAVKCLRVGRPDEALPVIAECSKADPTNPLFDFLRAAALWDEGKSKEATDAISVGAAKPAMHLYGTSHRDPNDWQWNEIERLCECAQDMINQHRTDKRILVAAIVMTDRIVWSEPPNVVRINRGISVRRSGAIFLRVLALSAGDQSLIRMCDELIHEGRKFSTGVNRKTSGERFSLGMRAWALQGLLKQHDRYAVPVTIVRIDEQARWTKACRDEYLTRGLADHVVAASERLRLGG